LVNFQWNKEEEIKGDSFPKQVTGTGQPKLDCMSKLKGRRDFAVEFTR
jgi:hypothetical protein